MNTIPLLSNSKNGRSFYELHISEQKAFIEYSIFNENLVLLISSGVTRNLINQNQVREALIERTLDRLKHMNFKIISYCPIINEFLNNRIQYKNMIAPNNFI